MRKRAVLAVLSATLLGALLVAPTTQAANVSTVESFFSTSCKPDTSGKCVIPHTLGVVPDYVQVAESIRNGWATYAAHDVRDARGATSITVRAVPLGATKPATLYLDIHLRGTVTTPTEPDPPVEPAPDPDPVPDPTPDPTPDPGPAPTAGAVCGTSSLDGPTTAPVGATVVSAGDNSGINFGLANTTYWFEPGVHTLGPDQYSQIVPASGSTFVGAPGAIIDGQGVNQYAFTQQATNVTIKYLTIKNFVPPMNEGTVNHDSGNGWTVEHNTLTLNGGAALMAGKDNIIRYNCLKDNGQYGLNAYQAGDGPTSLLLEGNEFTGNNTGDWESQIPGCGCTGAMKFWSVDKADVRGNWIHHNHGAGIWADNNNNDFLIESNLIEANEGQAIFYEQSYNGLIRDNTIRGNTWETGRDFATRGDVFPIGTVYVSEAGGDSRIPARYTSLEITGNTFEDNWGGVALWENADRFCNSPANTASDCTLPMGGNLDRVPECSQPGIASEPLYSDCRWRTRNVDVHHNTFTIDTAQVDGGCPAAYCATSAVFSNWGSYPDWSPYKERKIQELITFGQGNRWHDNTYQGPWSFVPYEMGNLKPFAEWQAAPYSQDAGSTN